MATVPSPISEGRLAKVTSGFGPREGGMYSFHYGVDFTYPHKGEPKKFPWTSRSGRWAVPDGLYAVSFLPGVVTSAKWLGTGAGVKIDHGGGISTFYAHGRNLKVKKGQKVSEGQPLFNISYSPWKSGCKSTPTNPCKLGLNHLHWEVHKNGRPVDPEPYLKGARNIQNPSGIGAILFKLALVGGISYATYRYVLK